ncbi:site-specific DNA-methyltransferase [Synechococcus sp. AH-551-G15]|nr:site-specific DNA-methyltransferase [Synechococcus sp. AH-551-G15]
MKTNLLLGNCIDTLKELEDNSVDSVVTDPPYGLSFMGRAWDYDVPKKEIWKECLRVLKPGGHLLSFSSSRTYHRMTVEVEDAGFEIRDQIMWVYGSGFPKSHNVSISIDKQLSGMKHRGKRTNYGTTMITTETGHLTSQGDLIERDKAMPKHEPMCEESKQWEGWGTALKPAHEPIVVARKPIEERTVALNVLKWGTGSLNIDASRVGTDSVTINTFDNGAKPFGDAVGEPFTSRQSEGRWPANLIHDGSDEVLELFPENAHSFFYCPKASKSDRNEGIEGMPTKGKVFNGQSSEPSKNIKGLEKRWNTQPSQNFHPTVKPTELMSYLIKLVTQPGGIVLDPFMGSGSTGKAAVRGGFSFIGCELNEEYLQIAKTRIDYELTSDKETEVVEPIMNKDTQPSDLEQFFS